MSSLRAALTFLTRVPLGARLESPAALAASLPWFPLVGAAIGLVTAAVYAGASRLWPASVSAVLAVIAATLLTGGFHEDGLADTADAFGGSFDRERALEIFKDPRHGSYGVLALVLSVALRVFVIASLAPREALFVLPAAHALSRGVALQLLGVLRPATTGLGSSYAAEAGRGVVLGALGVSVAIAAAATGLLAAPLALVAMVPVALVGWLARRKIGGVNGDVLGAAQQVSELVVLLTAVAAIGTGVTLAWLA